MKIALAFLAFLAGCSSVQQTLDTKLFYKRDVEIEINQVKHEGVTVVPHSQRYDITLRPKGDLDLILLRTCHREYSGEKVSSGFLSSKVFKYIYVPVPGVEDHGVCPLRVDVYESSKGRHSWALIDFESPDHTVTGQLTCNGEIRRFRGVSICQGKAGTIQHVEFDAPVRFAPAPNGCAAPKMISPNVAELKLSLGECLFYFDTQSGQMGRLTTVGYEGVLVREGQ